MEEEKVSYSESSTAGLYFENRAQNEMYFIYPRFIPFKLKEVYINNERVKDYMLEVEDNMIICHHYAVRDRAPNIRIYYDIIVLNKEDFE